MTQPSGSRFVYVTYIRTTADQLWSALTHNDWARRYWLGIQPEADWRAGGAWALTRPDGVRIDEGEIVEFEPPRRLAIRWRHLLNPEMNAEGWSHCTFELEPVANAVKLTVNHAIDRPDSKFIGAVSGGWPQILSNLKSLLETGEVALPPRYG